MIRAGVQFIVGFGSITAFVLALVHAAMVIEFTLFASRGATSEMGDRVLTLLLVGIVLGLVWLVMRRTSIQAFRRAR